MKTICAAILAVIATLSMSFGIFGQAHAGILEEKAGKYVVQIVFDKGAPVKGQNDLTIVVNDESGNKVTDVKVEVRYFMSQRLSPTAKSVEMPYMGSTVGALLSDSTYSAKIDLHMTGSWHIQVKVTDTNGVSGTAKFYVTVG